MKQFMTLLILPILLLTGCREQKSESKAQMAIEEEKDREVEQDAWITLFDGTSMDAWKGYGSDSVPEYWSIQEGAMIFSPPEDRPEGESYNLVSRQEFGDFVLSLEWRISEGGNSGIFWGVFEDPKFGQPYQTGPEIQVLDNLRHSDAKNGTTHQAGALYDMVAPSSDLTRPAGEWNHFLITVDYGAGQGKVEMNGEEILTFPLGDAAWDAMVVDSKFNGWEGFGEYHTGKIGLQDHGDVVSFRNIKIKPL
jgi:hypothetical protein